ncbi:MAG: hypothetical protein O3A51_10670, partial [Verrucomicrobia bacterium]|nr:hypothetical protein [Verrucomicrobiota bacterium]
MGELDFRFAADPVDQRVVRPSLDGIGDSFQAGFEETSTLANLIEAESLTGLKVRFPPREGYSAVDDPKLKPYSRFMSRLEDSGSPQETDFRIQKIEESRQRQEALGYNSLGALAGIAAGLLTSPENYLVPGAAIRSIGKGLALGAGIGLAGEIPYYLAHEDADPVISAAAVVGVAGMTGLSVGFINRVNRSRVSRLPAEVPDEVASARGLGADAEPNLRPEVYAARSGVGADVAPGVSPARTFAEDLDDLSLVKTGVGLERLGFNPVLRLLNSASVAARQIVRDMVEDGGLLFNEYARGTNSSRSPIEKNFRTNWEAGDADTPGINILLEQQEQSYARYLGVEVGNTPSQTSLNVLRKEVGDLFTRNSEPRLSRRGFREEVGKAMRRGDAHEIAEVAETARNWRKLSDRLKDAAVEEDLFTAELRHRRARILRKADAEGINGVARQLDQYEQDVIQAIDTQIDLIRSVGAPRTTTAQSYFMRIMKLDKIEKEAGRFKEEVIKPYLRSKGMPDNVIESEADQLVKDIISTPDHAHIGPDDLSPANSVRERDWDIADDLLEEWLENDVEQVMRYQTRSLGTDIEISRQFGDYTMGSVIEDIRADWITRIRGATSPEQAADYTKGMEADLRDIRALRDRLRGTYGQPTDPYRALSQFYRVTKSLATLAYMGGVAVSSAPDMARPAMVEGFSKAMRAAWEPLFTETGRLARRLSAQELRMAGSGSDIITSQTASQLADIGDIAGRRFPLERVLGNLTEKLFMINGLNWWNTTMKEWSGILVSTRLIDESANWAAGTISDVNRTKLLRSNIDEAMANRIHEMFQRHGVREGAIRLPNTLSWEDKGAVAAFRGALSQDVNRIIVTPGVGDKALWTSTEWGSVMTQFKTYGQSSMQRILISGLQEKDAAFF